MNASTSPSFLAAIKLSTGLPHQTSNVGLLASALSCARDSPPDFRTKFVSTPNFVEKARTCAWTQFGWGLASTLSLPVVFSTGLAASACLGAVLAGGLGWADGAHATSASIIPTSVQRQTARSMTAPPTSSNLLRDIAGANFGPII